jgi:hypothetical protein
MGSQGMKRRRKGGHAEHLPKVGTRTQIEAEQHREREAVLDVMGVHERPGGGYAWLTWVAIVLIIAVAVAGAASLAFID